MNVNAVNKCRHNKRLTSIQLAKRISVSTRTINELENGKGNSTFKTIYDLSNALEVDPELYMELCFQLWLENRSN